MVTELYVFFGLAAGLVSGALRLALNVARGGSRQRAERRVGYRADPAGTSTLVLLVVLAAPKCIGGPSSTLAVGLPANTMHPPAPAPRPARKLDRVPLSVPTLLAIGAVLTVADCLRRVT